MGKKEEQEKNEKTNEVKGNKNKKLVTYNN